MFPFTDAFSGYDQIKIDPLDVEKTVFQTHMGNSNIVSGRVVSKILVAPINEH